ncbi:MAG: AAA family ATPase [Candidatus Hydrothermales bacterium]
MLLYLHLKNYLLVPEIELNFKEGFICFTGETGAGKSMILETLLLLKGEKLDWSLFEGLKETVVEGLFKIEKPSNLLKKYDISPEDEVFVQRILNPEQRISKVRINGIPVSLSLLREIFEKEIEIHGQSSQIYFLNKKNYIDILDRYSGLKEEISEFEELFNLYKRNLKELEDLEKDYERILTMKEFMEHSVKELEEIKIENLNINEIFEEYDKLHKRKELKEKIEEIVYALSDSEDSIINNISKILRKKDIFKGVGVKAFEFLKEAEILLNEALKEFVKVKFEREVDEKRLEELEGILQKVEELKRKHRTFEDGLIILYRKWKSELESLETLRKRVIELRENIKELENELEKRAENLSTIRKKKAKEFEKELENMLLKLGFSYIKFEIQFLSRKIYEKGIDEVDFLISTSKDSDFFPLTKIASLGELSRIILAIKTLISEIDEKKIMIFDEIDTGIGGEVARIVGKNLKNLSKGKQVFCITHLPQIASYSDHHFYVYKEMKGKRAEIMVRELKTFDERKREIARMISGKSIDEVSLKAAEKLLKESSL